MEATRDYVAAAHGVSDDFASYLEDLLRSYWVPRLIFDYLGRVRPARERIRQAAYSLSDRTIYMWILLDHKDTEAIEIFRGAEYDMDTRGWDIELILLEQGEKPEGYHEITSYLG